MSKALATRDGDQLALNLETIRDQLAKCGDVLKVLEMRNQANAIKVYQRSRDASLEVQNDAAEVTIRCERRLGELLRTQPRNPGAAVPRGSKVDPRDISTLADKGIGKTEAHRYRQLAVIPQNKFNTTIKGLRNQGRLSRNAVISGEVIRTVAKPSTPADYINTARKDYSQPVTIVRSMDTRCTRCGMVQDLTEVVEEMISRMSARLAAGKKIEIPGIGTLRPKAVGKRKLKSIDGKNKMIAGWVQIRFRAAEAIKKLVNKGRRNPEDNDDDNDDGAKSKRPAKRRRAVPGKNNG